MQSILRVSNPEGQGEKLSCNAVAAKDWASPTGRSRAEMAFRVVLNSGRRTALVITQH